jgi:hypothetical protein
MITTDFLALQLGLIGALALGHFTVILRNWTRRAR